MGNPRAKYDIVAQDKTKGALKSVDRNLKKLTTGFKAAGAAVGGIFAAGFVASKINQFQKAADSLDELAKSSQSLGLSVDQLDRWRFAAERSGASGEQLGVALRTLQKNITDVSAGTGEARAVFEELGIDVKDSAGALRSAQSVILEIADKLQTYGSRTRQVAAVQRLFGESGTALLPLLKQQKEGIADLFVEAERIGTIYAEDAKKAEAFKDAQTNLNRQLERITTIAASKAMEPLTRALEAIAGFLAPKQELSAFQRWWVDLYNLDTPQQIQAINDQFDTLTKRAGLLRSIKMSAVFGEREYATAARDLYLINQQFDKLYKRVLELPVAAAPSIAAEKARELDELGRVLEREYQLMRGIFQEVDTLQDEVFSGPLFQSDLWEAGLKRFGDMQLALKENSDAATILGSNFASAYADIATGAKNAAEKMERAFVGAVGNIVEQIIRARLISVFDLFLNPLNLTGGVLKAQPALAAAQGKGPGGQIVVPGSLADAMRADLALQNNQNEVTRFGRVGG